MTFHLFSPNFSQILEGHFSWQAQYLVRLEDVASRSAHCKKRFMCEENSAWDSFFVAGAVFGEVGGCCLSHRAL